MTGCRKGVRRRPRPLTRVDTSAACPGKGGASMSPHLQLSRRCSWKVGPLQKLKASQQVGSQARGILILMYRDCYGNRASLSGASHTSSTAIRMWRFANCKGSQETILRDTTMRRSRMPGCQKRPSHFWKATKITSSSLENIAQ